MNEIKAYKNVITHEMGSGCLNAKLSAAYPRRKSSVLCSGLLFVLGDMVLVIVEKKITNHRENRELKSNQKTVDRTSCERTLLFQKSSQGKTKNIKNG